MPINPRQFIFDTMMILLIVFFLFIISTIVAGCTAAQRQIFKDGLVSTSDCAVHSSLGCAAQAMGGCPPPLTTWESEQWGDYGSCLAEKAASCSASALARCAFRSIVNSIDGPVVGGGAGCNDSVSKEQIEQCVLDADIETEAEAVQAVAYCTRKVCLNMED